MDTLSVGGAADEAALVRKLGQNGAETTAGAVASAEAALPAHLPLSPEDAAALLDLHRRGTPAASLRALERDLLYVTAWVAARFGRTLAWPEDEATALAFVLDHARDLGATAPEDPARRAADHLIAEGLRKRLACPASATLDRRIASWATLHRIRNLHSPFKTPAVAEARAKARRANARPHQPKSAHPITREVLERLLAAIPPGLRGIRDRAILCLAFASGGRRRSEVAGLHRADVSLEEFDAAGRLWIRLLETKTTGPEEAPRLPLKGRAARALLAWIDAGEISEGPLFRPISKSGRVLDRPLSAAAVGEIVKIRLEAAGYPRDFASAHGLRAGFLTQAALDGAPVQAAMRLSLHRSAAQAGRYYADVDIAENPATDLLD